MYKVHIYKYGAPCPFLNESVKEWDIEREIVSGTIEKIIGYRHVIQKMGYRLANIWNSEAGQT